MARDAMRMLRTVRLHAVEQARHALGACLAAEAAVRDRLQAIEQAAQRDRLAHEAMPEAHQFVDMFSQRLQVSAVERRECEAELAAAEAASAQARAAVVAARTAAEAIETLITERAAAEEVDERRREQHALDDMTRSRVN